MKNMCVWAPGPGISGQRFDVGLMSAEEIVVVGEFLPFQTCLLLNGRSVSTNFTVAIYFILKRSWWCIVSSAKPKEVPYSVASMITSRSLHVSDALKQYVCLILVQKGTFASYWVRAQVVAFVASSCQDAFQCHPMYFLVWNNDRSWNAGAIRGLGDVGAGIRRISS